METKRIALEEIADKFFEEQEKLNFSYDSRESFIEGYKLAQQQMHSNLREFSSWLTSEYNGPDVEDEVIEEFLRDSKINLKQ